VKRSKLQAVWFSLNLFLFGLMIVALGSDVWEAYMFLFVASAIGQYLVLLRNRKTKRENK
jgi:hypothetical protein